jgi:hypothetical protein
MVLVNDDPFVTLNPQTGGQTEIERPSRRNRRSGPTDGERHVGARRNLNLCRFEHNLSARIREEKVPRLVVIARVVDEPGMDGAAGSWLNYRDFFHFCQESSIVRSPL